MDMQKASEVLRLHNEWRRSPLPTEQLIMQNPTEIGLAIDLAVQVLSEQAEKDLAE